MKKIALLMLGLLGCSGKSATHYDVFISSDFSEEQQGSLVKSLEKWEAATGVHFDIHSLEWQGQSIDNFDEVSDGQIVIVSMPSWKDCITYNDVNNGPCWAITTHTSEKALVKLPLDKHGEEFKWTALHEEGHALNLKHLEDNTVMAPYFHTANHEITCEDVREYNSLRGDPGWECH